MIATSKSALFEFTSDIIMLMGVSFILGVLFTTFILLILEFVRRNSYFEEYTDD